MAKENPNGRKVISGVKLKQLLAADRRADHDIGELVGQRGEAIAQAVEKHNLNKRVYGIIKKLDRLPPEKLKIDLDDLEHMLDASGLRERAESAPSFDDVAAAGDSGDDDQNETEADEEEQTKAARRKVARAFPMPQGHAAE